MQILRQTRLLPLALISVFAGAACTVSLDHEGYTEHDEKRFAADKPVELSLTTFDGALEVRSWDRPEVVVAIQKRGPDKNAVSAIEVVADRTGDHIHLEARRAGGAFVGFGFNVSPSVKFVASVPRTTSLILHTGDGSIVVERVNGRVELRSGDGKITATEVGGDLIAESGDGVIELEGAMGRVDARTADGSLRVSGTPTVVHAHSGDGSIVLRVASGAVMAADWEVSTGDGSISVELPRDFNAEIDADPSSGRTRSDLTLVNATGGTRDEPALRGRLGDGGHTLKLRTGDGNIRLSGS